jgi:RNA polymerase sigma factor (sigma-70 family)
MKHKVEFKNLEAVGRLRQLMERFTARLERQFPHVAPDALFLRGVVEKHPVRALYRVSLVLNLPRRTLVAQEERTEAERALREAFAEIGRQAARHKAFLRREHLWKRPARREERRQQTKAAPAPPDERQRRRALDLVLTNLDTLYNFARREIAYYVATGDLARGDLRIEDVVDSVILRASRELDRRPPNLDASWWLLKLAREQILSDVRRLRTERAQSVAIEEDVPGTPPKEAVVTLGDEIFDFYQPDEDLKLEDLVPDANVPTPEQILESRDLQRFVNQTLARMPKAWRDAFVLHHAEGLSLGEVAAVTGQPQPEVRRHLEHAREFLRQKIAESGLAVAA